MGLEVLQSSVKVLRLGAELKSYKHRESESSERKL